MGNVIIGSARHDENGKYSGGSANYNTPDEISTQNFYMHSKGWYILRCKNAAKRQAIADAMQLACDSEYIGYDQSERNTLFTVLRKYNFDFRKLTVYCETDCSALVRVCCAAAGITLPDFYTGNESQVLTESGYFDRYLFTDENLLMRGDILVTKTKGHTVVVLTDGENVTETVPRWIHSNGKYYYRKNIGVNAHGWELIDRYWYYFNDKGEALTGAHKIGSELYYFCTEAPYECALMVTNNRGALEPWKVKTVVV